MSATKHMVTISKRRLKAYQRAEMVAQELRHQISNWRDQDGPLLATFVTRWIQLAPKDVCFDRPEKPKKVWR